MNVKLDDKSTIEWAQFVAIITVASTLIWMLSKITQQLEAIETTLRPLVIKVDGQGERIIRLESRADNRADNR